jgi:hypothetical protein
MVFTCVAYSYFLHTCPSSAHKRIRKPSKRLIEWTEEYDQIFSTRKKPKKALQSLGKVAHSNIQYYISWIFRVLYHDTSSIPSSCFSRWHSPTATNQIPYHQRNPYMTMPLCPQRNHPRPQMDKPLPE